MATPNSKMKTPKMRTPMSRYRRRPAPYLNNSFKSPVRTPAAPLPPKDQASLAQEVEMLRMKEAGLKEQVERLQQEGYDEADLPECTRMLHRYNEMKDVGQMLLGRLATLEGVTMREMYQRFGLDLED
ncbi:PREDICTED: DNA repair protein SWI5 homolog [Branchiostoma belcheri]|uniref:DNA repair protein SWI5 homolog n=1 Tax=Branchiostoma belcheri TaxID=7741 RepID=A0A6P5A2G2_BRABE|nr:PREDICTED: DNA repair protein SWI5 homolog [Branchiostoma belcheri]